jgi:glucose-6-phosphate-specific signal transduction histidine kinase
MGWFRGGTTLTEVRTISLLAIAILAFRVLFTAAPLPVLMYEGGAGVIPLSLGLASLTLSTMMVVFVARGVDLAGRFGPLLAVDLVLSCAVGLSASALSADSETPFHAVLWFPFHGTVMLWTVLLGVAWGWAAVAVGVGLFVAMYTSRHLGEPDVLPLLLSHAVWLVLPLGVAVLASVLLRRIVHAILAQGVRAGRSHGQVQMSRTLHDTVLQTLESIARRADDERDGSHERLSQLGAAAARQAAELRQLLQKPAPHEDSPLAELLRGFGPEFAARGLRVELVLGDLAGSQLAPAAQAAIGEATREALSNVVKHADVRKAVVSAGRTADGVEVVIRDRGRGFAPQQQVAGFGIRQSIVARMRDAGGGALIWSEPGRGTRVRLTAPGRGAQ